MCNKIIKEIEWSGMVNRRYCLKPVFKDGLCVHHYKRKITKAIPYGEREGYKEATQKDFDDGRTLYLKTMGSYGGHRYFKGIIASNNGYNRPTKIKADLTLFVVNDYYKTKG